MITLIVKRREQGIQRQWKRPLLDGDSDVFSSASSGRTRKRQLAVIQADWPIKCRNGQTQKSANLSIKASRLLIGPNIPEFSAVSKCELLGLY